MSNPFTALVALLKRTNLSLSDEWRDSLGFTGELCGSSTSTRCSRRSFTVIR